MISFLKRNVRVIVTTITIVSPSMSATIPAIRTELWYVNYQDLTDSGVNFCKISIFRPTMEYLDRISNEHFLYVPLEKPCRPICNHIDQLQVIPDGHTHTNENVF
jgi:hypothetical protein